ncbi:DUF11 domain-containing protein [Nakamurella flavida]|uniref:DUF11 domain-containing protein n=1 Tax=Nakamurella flavida TaxID=363630 RepID=A0A939C615_9ACTN|nr:DUF11 domain-containing protein [Nakamurella flavida]MBM9477524.1 DUF11 domain-containing protein [Nakamurella flavida]MDP9777457.1 putative repeat protein (TIGR01451 family) [Nakamurella flavida]
MCAAAVLALTGFTLFIGPAASAEPATAGTTVAAESAAAEPAAPAAPAAPAPAGPQLSIAVDDGRDTAAEGDQLAYTVTVTNLGTDAVAGLRISQLLPTGTTFVSADQDGVQDGGTVVWQQDLAASEVFTARVVATVGAPAAGELRLAGVACAALAADQPPLVCASDSDQLPAGAAADAAQAAAAGASGGDAAAVMGDGPRWWWFAGGAGVLVLVGAATALTVRHRRSDVATPPAAPVEDRLPVG